MKDLLGQEIHNDMIDMLGENAPSHTTVKSWITTLQPGRTSIEDEPPAITPGIIAKVHNILLDNRRMKGS